MLEGEERKGTKELFEVRTEFSKINDRLKPTDPGSLEDSKLDKY